MHLTHAANSNAVSASYNLIDVNGNAVGNTVNFSATDTLFNTADWIQAQIIAASPATDDSYRIGADGALSVDPVTGAWNYSLLNGSQQVQALGANASTNG